MLVVDHNTYFVNWGLGNTVRPMDYAGDVVVVFDPSKSNMAMVLGTPDGTILNIIEFSGNNRKKGPAMDTTLYCQEVRAFLREYLKNVNLYLVGMEAAIMKEGNKYYHSMQVLNEIRGDILNFFKEEYNIQVIEINNWAWKASILPEGYRGKFDKGSKRYFQQFYADTPYAYYFEADATDCICMYWYLVKHKCAQYSCYCNISEVCSVNYTHFFVSLSSGIITDMRKVLFNPRFTLDDNLHYYVNRIMTDFYMTIPVSIIPPKEVYDRSVGFRYADMQCNEINAVGRRL